MSNDHKLKVRQNVSKKIAFKELTIIRDTIFWIDVVGEGQNENAIFARPFNDKEAFPQKLTSKKYNIKNNFHGYGGKSYKCINFKNNFGQGLKVYSQSKLANMLFTRYLAIKLSTDNISVNAIHPGGVNTALGNQNESWYSKPLKMILRPFFRSPLKGAESIIYLATKEDDGVTGEYFVDSKIAKSTTYSKNLEEAHKLWNLSEELVNQTFEL